MFWHTKSFKWELRLLDHSDVTYFKHVKNTHILVTVEVQCKRIHFEEIIHHRRFEVHKHKKFVFSCNSDFLFKIAWQPNESNSTTHFQVKIIDAHRSILIRHSSWKWMSSKGCFFFYKQNLFSSNFTSEYDQYWRPKYGVVPQKYERSEIGRNVSTKHVYELTAICNFV